MATPAFTTSASNPTAPINATRWGRNGEPGSALGGLTRGSSRGRGTGRGGKGGRGGRSNGTNREHRPDLESRLEKLESSQEKPKPPQIKPSTPAAAIASPNEKPQNSTKPKPPPSRRASRSIPSSIVTHISAPSSEVQTPSSTSRPSNRRRRSQTGKHSNVPPKIDPPTVDDNLSRPGRPRLPPAPHSAPIKDTPPHLSNSTPFDMRTNIDALVERVRAVAMAENRPSTPGSHIDWAGDDDDSLPDLDDWGVSTTGSHVVAQPQTISPIIVDGLKPLPEPVIKTSVTEVILAPELAKSVQKHEKETPNVTSPPPTSQHKDAKPISQTTTGPPTPGNTNVSSHRQDQDPAKSNRKPLHPSLPPKPLSPSAVTTSGQVNRWTAATPMRTPPFNKNTFNKEKVPEKSTEMSSSEVEPDDSAEKPSIIVSQVEVLVESERALSEGGNSDRNNLGSKPIADAVSEIKVEEAIYVTTAHDPLFHGIGNEEGLSASIHAPKAMSDSISAPANLSTYAELPAPRTAPFIHSRAHTVGRSPAFWQQTPTDSSPRYSRSGYSTPRGGNHHTRTHSSPPAGTALNNHRTLHMTRPVITGDAISRLARTIVLSTPKSTPVVGSTD